MTLSCYCGEVWPVVFLKPVKLKSIQIPFPGIVGLLKKNKETTVFLNE